MQRFMGGAAAAKVAGRVLVAAGSEAALAQARQLGAGGFVLPAALAALPAAQRKWAAVGAVLSTGCSVVPFKSAMIAAFCRLWLCLIS